METFDPATGKQLPPDAIQRVLFIAPSVHVYNIPPLASTKGYTAATWTEDPRRHIFTARLRVIETAVPVEAKGEEEEEEKVKTDIVLEDSSTGQLFAAAPYTAASAVEPALDSSRFFALRVQDEAGRKAVLGVGFEERGESFDFGVSLQEARKALGLDQHHQGSSSAAAAGGSGKGAATAATGVVSSGVASAPDKQQGPAEVRRDYSLKEGETITVNLGGSKFGRRPRPEGRDSSSSSAAAGEGATTTNLSAFSLAPPPSAASSKSSAGGGGGSSFGSGSFSLPPPPTAQGTRAARVGSTSGGQQQKKTAADLGFDDGQFGEFA